MANTLVWADIPVKEMDRAREFYGALLQAEIGLMDGAGGAVALLPGEPGDVSADLVLSDDFKPSKDGARVYLDCNGDMEGMIDRAVRSGGALVQPPADMGDMVGTIAFISDTEGNRLGLHKPPKS